jgi:hypothetical protein
MRRKSSYERFLATVTVGYRKESRWRPETYYYQAAHPLSHVTNLAFIIIFS